MSERRDYTQVSWPWDGDPNWGPPRVGATYEAGDDENWRLACAECDLYFPKEIQLEIVMAHCVELHDRAADSEESLQLNLVWVGLGPPPLPLA